MLRIGVAVLGIALLLALAASPIMAQEPVRIQTMTVSLWLEYDQEGVLVIYRGAIADDVPLPVMLRFLIPKEAGKPAATAGVDATGQFRYRSYQLADAGGFLEVSYTNPYREFQMEYYYNPLVVTDALRSFVYQFRADYAVDNLTIEVKEPAGSQNLNLTPVATGTGTDFDNLPLQKYALGAFTAGQTFQFSATYEKTDPRLTSEILGLEPPGTAQFEDVAQPSGSQNVVAYILLGAAGTLLLGAAVYAIVQARRRPKPQPVSRPTGKKPRRAAPPKGAPAGAGVGFCHQCGARLKPGAQYCANCGARVKRR
ncbi:MAG: zinc ribbon domain-containing protein [Anaerolineae bacterium]|nr:zinc ribbon domain-containing protein [Anaerolineae bacterium]